MSARRRRIAVVAVATACLASLAFPAASRADQFVPAPTGVTVAFQQWHAGVDRMLVSWDAPAAPADHFDIAVAGGTDPANAQVSVPGDQTSALVDVATGANPVLHNQLVFTMYAWSQDGTTRSNVSSAVVTPSVLGAQLVGGVESGVSGQGRISWPAPAAGDLLLLRQVTGGGDPFTTGTPVSIDGTQAGSITVPTDAHGQTPQYALYEQVAADPAQRSPASFAQGQAAPNAVTNLSATFAEDGTSMHVSWGLPTGCPTAYWITHCMEVRVAVKEGTIAPTSPTDGTALVPAVDDLGVENFGTTVTGLHPGHTYSVAAFNTPYGSLGDYSPRVAMTSLVDLLTPQVGVTGTYPQTVTYGERVSVPVVVTGWDGVAPLAGSPVSVVAFTKPNSLTVVAAGVTNTKGKYAAKFRPQFTASYQAQVPATATYGAGVNNPDDPVIFVEPTLSLEAGKDSVPHGSSVRIKGVIGPHFATTIALQRHSASGWHTIDSTTSGPKGKFHFTCVVKKKGNHHYRVTRAGDDTLLSGVSPTVAVAGT